MNYIKELTEQLDSLKNGNKVKINIHFIISEPLISYCYNINKQIKKHSIGFINLSKEDIVTPHISIYMGYIDNYEMLKPIFHIVSEYAKELKPFTINPINLYFKSVAERSPQYLFMGLLQNDYIIEQKYNVNDLLQRYLYPLEWDMKTEDAHITVGCYKNITNNVLSELDLYKQIPSCKISQIGVSIAGKRGVCLGILKAYDLN